MDNSHPSYMVKRKCKLCDQDFMKPRSDIRRGKGKFCSTKCQYESLRKRVYRECPVCSKQVFARPHEVARGKGVFCSTECFGIYRDKKRELECDNCGKTYLEKECRVDRSRFCSRNCQGAWKARQNYKQTDIEKITEGLLASCRIEFVCQHPIGPYVCDFFVTPNFVIEADGVYWHSLPINQERDKKKDKYLHNLGYSVLRLRGDDIRNNPAKCYARILEHVNPLIERVNLPYAQGRLFSP